MNKAIFKFNNGNGALLCSGCHCIIKVGFQYTKEEIKASTGEIELPEQYCEACKDELEHGVDDSKEQRDDT